MEEGWQGRTDGEKRAEMDIILYSHSSVHGSMKETRLSLKNVVRDIIVFSSRLLSKCPKQSGVILQC